MGLIPVKLLIRESVRQIRSFPPFFTYKSSFWRLLFLALTNVQNHPLVIKHRHKTGPRTKDRLCLTALTTNPWGNTLGSTNNLVKDNTYFFIVVFLNMTGFIIHGKACSNAQPCQDFPNFVLGWAVRIYFCTTPTGFFPLFLGSPDLVLLLFYLVNTEESAVILQYTFSFMNFIQKNRFLTVGLFFISLIKSRLASDGSSLNGAPRHRPPQTHTNTHCHHICHIWLESTCQPD